MKLTKKQIAVLSEPTMESIRAKGQSWDVVSSKKEGETNFRDKYNFPMGHVYVRAQGAEEIDGVTYSLYECYVDSGSDDYFYFAVKN